MRPFRILTATVILLGVFALPAMADGDTTTTVINVEVCRDDQIITIPTTEMLQSDDPITNDFQRDNCKPPRSPVETVPLPGPTIRFPLIRVGYACPGTDGQIVELPWGSYEDMWPTVELAALYGCPVEQPTVDSPTVAPVAVSVAAPEVETSVVEMLPFTGPSDTVGLTAAGLAALIVGGLLVGVARRQETGSV